MRFWNIKMSASSCTYISRYLWPALGVITSMYKVNQYVQELATILVFQNRIQGHCEQWAPSIEVHQFSWRWPVSRWRVLHIQTRHCVYCLSIFVGRESQSFSQQLDNRWSAGDENCLPDNVNCDGNLWYRGKVDTSEVIWYTLLYSSIMSLSWIIGSCNITSMPCSW